MHPIFPRLVDDDQHLTATGKDAAKKFESDFEYLLKKYPPQSQEDKNLFFQYLRELMEVMNCEICIRSK